MPTVLDIMAGLSDPGMTAVIRVRQRKQVLPASEARLTGGIHVGEIALSPGDPRHQTPRTRLPL